MLLKFNQVVHYYNKRAVLSGLSFNLEAGEIGVLVGPSGAGKSTVLNCIAGLEHIKDGSITIDDVVVSGPKVHLPAEKRKIGMMFQDSTLFPHLSVAENVCFGIAKDPNRKQRLDELSQECRLEKFIDARVYELSGGQQQRVALARALAPKPRLLLLDEPFCSCDVVLRKSLLTELHSIIKEEYITALMVTHDQAEAFSFADRCGVIDSGTLCQWDTVYNLYHRPNCALVASFIGEGSLLPGKLVSNHAVTTELGIINSDQQLTTLLLNVGNSVNVLIRPDDIVLSASGAIEAKVAKRQFRGASILYTLHTATGTKLYASLSSNQDLAEGQTVGVTAKVEHVVVYPSIN